MTSSESYDDLRNRLLQENLLYEDEEFPADDSSIGIEGNYVWKRPNVSTMSLSLTIQTQPLSVTYLLLLV